MSLINDMLKNLEQRQSHDAVARVPLLEGVAPHHDHALFSRLRAHYVWFLYIFIVLLLMIYLLWPVSFKSHKAITPLQAKPLAKTASLTTTAPPTQPTTYLPGGTRVDAFGISGDSSNTRLTIYLNHNAPYSVTTDQPHNLLTLTLANTQLAEPLLPIDTHKTVIQNMQITHNNNQLQIILSLLNGTQITQVMQSTTPTPQLILDLNNPAQILATTLNSTANNTPALTTPGLNGVTLDNNDDYAQANNFVVEKIPEPLTAEQMADMTYQKALDLVQKNRTPTAINLLKQLLVQMPSYFNAREALVTLLIQQGQLQEATTVINEGLKLQPHYSPFTKLAAQIFMAKNQPSEALAILETAMPPLTEDPDYYAFIAALYQRLNQPLAAAKLYNELSEQFPNNSLWWLGLATSFETLGKKRAALEAYHNASASGNLNPALETFVERKIDLLGN